MEQNVRYYWIHEQASHSCPNHIIYNVNLYILLPKFAFRMQRTEVGNEQFVSVLFIIPVVTDIYGHRFQIFTLVSEIHENIDLVFSINEYI